VPGDGEAELHETATTFFPPTELGEGHKDFACRDVIDTPMRRRSALVIRLNVLFLKKPCTRNLMPVTNECVPHGAEFLLSFEARG
jgi:hypothetical protein